MAWPVTMAAGPSSCCLLLLLAGYAAPVPRILREGSPCWDAETFKSGTCFKVRHCQRAVEAIRNYRRMPSRCAFVGFDEIVCCTDDHKGGTQRSPSLPDHDRNGSNVPEPYTQHSPTGTGDPQGQRPSVWACRVYEDDNILKVRYILKGQPARELELPHMAALGYKLPDTEGISWLCGGTLISDQFILTAAHCCARRPLRVRLGAVDLTSPGDDRAQYGISQVVVHPSYRRRQFTFDIALLKLDRTVEFRLGVFPACLNNQDGDPPSLIAAGWGATNPAGTRKTSTLMLATVYPFKLSDCKNSYKERFPKENSSSVLCAGDPEGKTDTCGGDSGGPLVLGGSAPYIVVGITSKGLSPCGGKVPAIYTRVSAYIDWIEDHVWPSHD